MITTYYNGFVVAEYEPIGWRGGILIRFSQYQYGSRISSEVHVFSEDTYRRAASCGKTTVSRYWRDAARRLWRDTDCDNFHCTRFHGYMIDGDHNPIWVAERSDWPDSEPRGFVGIKEAAHMMERQWVSADEAADILSRLNA